MLGYLSNFVHLLLVTLIFYRKRRSERIGPSGMITHSRRTLWISCANLQQCKIFIISTLYFLLTASKFIFSFKIFSDLLLFEVYFERWMIQTFWFHSGKRTAAEGWVYSLVDKLLEWLEKSYDFCLLCLLILLYAKSSCSAPFNLRFNISVFLEGLATE